MGTPYFQQQSAAYNLYQKQNLHIFAPDGERYLVGAGGKSYADYATEVQDHLVQFEVESLLAQRDSLRDALARRYLIQHFGVAGDAHFSGIDLETTVAELKKRGLAPTPVKTALRSALTRANGEIKDIWPIRESGRNLQYTSYDLVFAAEEIPTPARRQKIWDIVAAWACKSRLPGKEGMRLATLQEWDDLGDGYAIRVDLHHYPRPDLESCRAITLLDATERNKDLELLRKALAKAGTELDELAVKPYAVPQNTPLHDAVPSPPKAPPGAAIAETLSAVRIERDRLEQQLRLLTEALTDSEERRRQAQRIASLESEINGMTGTLDRAAWADRPADWQRAAPAEKALRLAEAFELRQAALDTTQVQLTTARDKLNAAATRLHRTEDELEATHQALADAEQKLEQTRAQLEEKKLALAQSEKTLQIAQSELRLLGAHAQTVEKERNKLAEELRQTAKSRDEWQSRATNVETTLKAELLKQHNAALLAQELDFTRQMQEMQQAYMTQAQDAQQAHMLEIQELQATHLQQIQKLRRLSPHGETDEGWNVPQQGMYVPRRSTAGKPAAPEAESAPPPAPRQKTKTVASELGLYQAESQEIFDNRIGEYLRIAKDLGLSEADKWLLAEAKKLAEVRAKQGELEI